jgi:hypothetical protein
VTGALRTLGINAGWEVTRLRRSRRIWLLAIPPVAGPVGSAVADLYLKIPSTGTAIILGLLVTAGLAALILLDLAGLAVGEDLTHRSHLLFFPLPQGRGTALAGRLLVAVGGPVGAYLIGAAAIWALGGALVQAPAPGTFVRAPLFDPGHLLVALPGLLIFLAGVTAVAAWFTRRSSEAIVAGVLAGVVAAGGAAYLLAQGELTTLFPALLLVAGLGALAWTVASFPRLSV